MKVAVFNTKAYDKQYLSEAAQNHSHEVIFFEAPLNKNTCKLASGFDVVCAFVNDHLDKDVLTLLSKEGVRLLALRCAGFNNVDVKTAESLGITIARVPAYSPHGVAEHAVAIMLALNRQIYRAHNRIREGNFSLEGLLGFQMHGKTAGIIGTGKIGVLTAKILSGFGLHILAYDPYVNPELKGIAEYVPLNKLYADSDIISLHLPLTPDTYHIINAQSVQQMKKGVMIVNTSRGGLIDTQSVIEGLKSGIIGYLGLDVYEEEDGLFFEDLSGHVIQDDTFARLLTFPNVVITGHQAFFTKTALSNIAETTLKNISDFEAGQLDPANIVKSEFVK
ncbi:MAG: 2-hydroxyacid dehydrogenase [Candidatus Omnitrophica bacterium]|nr:2-hydroxyacid dehydrogenase [Candidatus Omnitrophota bacterium]